MSEHHSEKKPESENAPQPTEAQKESQKIKKPTWMSRILSAVLSVFVVGVILITLLLNYFSSDLPDYTQLESYEPPVVSRIYAGNGQLLTQYAQENRIFVPYDSIPKQVINAFVAAEDQHFFTHPGVDFLGVFRAVIQNIANFGTDKRLIGASTITQQVAKNFLLTNEISIARKAREAVLAFRIERAFSKEKILELYLNEIYLGGGAYGIASAAQFYFDKSLEELTLPEIAYLAGLPKAPNNYHPIRRYDAAKARRDYVLTRMMEDGYITPAEFEDAQEKPLQAKLDDSQESLDADYFAEEVRREVISMNGDEVMYKGGLYIKSTVDPKLQRKAHKVLRDGLEKYDRRYGYRGGVATLNVTGDWQKEFEALKPPVGLEDWELAVVLTTDDEGESAKLGLKDGRIGYMPFSEMTWAKPYKEEEDDLAPTPTKVSDVLTVGEVIIVEQMNDGQSETAEKLYSLRQIPKVNGAIVALDPHTGRVYALSGGFSFDISSFNRATQAKRQPGSAIKPFVYLTALENGFTPATVILDAPIVIDRGPGLPQWKPTNYSDKFYGPAPMRVGIEQSRNLMTIRLAQEVGMGRIVDTIREFNINENPPRNLSVALGSAETTLMNLTSAYGMLVNGGKEITPTLIDMIQNRHGRVIFKHDTRLCDLCSGENADPQVLPKLSDEREQVADPQSAYQIVSMLEGVVQRGTGQRVKALGYPLAGKTGTTNDARDAWFIGFTPDLVVGVYVGFDDPKPLGRGETGSSVAVPIFRDFMAGALKGSPKTPFRIPSGIKLVRMNAKTGNLAAIGDKDVILEAFKTGTEPEGEIRIIRGNDRGDEENGTTPSLSTDTGLGAIY